VPFFRKLGINGSIGNASDCPFRISGNKETELSRNLRILNEIAGKLVTSN
jgi:hypothetical protein